MNRGGDYNESAVRGHDTNSSLNPHSDRCDILVLVYEQPADVGGEICVYNSQELWRILKKIDSRLANVLRSNYPQDLRGEGYGDSKWCLAPIFWEDEEGMKCRYIRRFITDSLNYKDAPRITKEQLDALNLVDYTLSEMYRYELVPQKGDILILNNHRVLHSRTSFVDLVNKRLVHRTWIADCKSIELPIQFAPIFGSVKAKTVRGGVCDAGSGFHFKIGSRILLPHNKDVI